MVAPDRLKSTAMCANIDGVKHPVATKKGKYVRQDSGNWMNDRAFGELAEIVRTRLCKHYVRPQKQLGSLHPSILRKILGLTGITSELQTIGTATEINGKRILIEGKVLRIAKLEQEWCDDAGDPKILADALRKTADVPDILTFTQRLPDLEPQYGYQMELDALAVLPIKSYGFWWEKQIERQARNKIRKAQKKGVIVRPTDFDDKLIHGMTSIFNETPIRQGRHFLHYGKNFETIKRQFSRFLFRE